MAFAQDLLDEISQEERDERYERIVIRKNEELQVQEELYLALQQELEENLSPECAQALIDSV